MKWNFPKGATRMDSTSDSDEAEADFTERLQIWASTTDDEGSLQFTPHTGIAIEIPVSCGRWLVPCVESVLAQSSRHWRLYLLSNGSDSLSHRILRSIAALHHPQILVIFEKKVSIARARTLLSEASTEDYILPLDHTDMLHPDAVKLMLLEAERNPWFSIIRAERRFVNEQGHPIEAQDWLPFSDRHYENGMVTDLDNHCKPYLVSRRAYAKTSGWEGFDAEKFPCEDLDLCLRLEEQGTIELLTTPLYFHRLIESRLDRNKAHGVSRKVFQRLADKTIERIGLPLKRLNGTLPFKYERIPTFKPDVSMLEVVIPFYESDEEELGGGRNRPLAHKNLEFFRMSGGATFTQKIDAGFFPCHRVELMCVLLSCYSSTLTLRVTDPQSQETIAEGFANLMYKVGPGLITVKVSLDNRVLPVSNVLDLSISCTPTDETDSFNLALQQNMASMRMFRQSPGHSRNTLNRCIDSLKACGVTDEAIHIVNKKQSAATNRNEGFRQTTRPFVCFADDDVELLRKDTFAELLRVMEETRAAVIAPRLVTNFGTFFCADTYFDERMYPKPRGLGEPVSSEYQYTRAVPWLPSTFMICRREAVNCVGGFDEEYIGSQMEDVDFCLKIRQRDLFCFYAGLVDVMHYNYQRNDNFSLNFDRFCKRWSRHPHLFQSLIRLTSTAIK